MKTATKYKKPKKVARVKEREQAIKKIVKRRESKLEKMLVYDD